MVSVDFFFIWNASSSQYCSFCSFPRITNGTQSPPLALFHFLPTTIFAPALLDIAGGKPESVFYRIIIRFLSKGVDYVATDERFQLIGGCNERLFPAAASMKRSSSSTISMNFEIILRIYRSNLLKIKSIRPFFGWRWSLIVSPNL